MKRVDRDMVLAALLTIATAIFRLEYNSTPRAADQAEDAFDRFSP